ncbi:ribosomal large subunit pseudouridine synthase D [Desulfitobacterium sp. LBE]|uniref:RluA family pseudouridine synthase n=1 Tax=Desulfitobacterium sp. LBE TaxID=884086 RepID=UPI00119B7623|nr:RNA pseudouridine synthase [Desulfitobacterium sp. LBE]TWH58546.1 ribosomal large subunit pseudouridine synthase D [Desulfitobacterium sp. LBE]
MRFEGVGELFTIPIVYEDNHLLVVDKPPNILSQKDSTGDMDILTLLKQDIKIRYNKPGNVYLGLVHRLDRPVGGVMVFAKTSKSAARLSEQIRNREFTKTYLALIQGQPAKQKNTLIHYLVKDEKSNKVSAVKKGAKGAKEAILDYEVVHSQSDLSLVKVNLRTGRPHQIRVQFAHLGHPLYGDYKYGKIVKTSKTSLTRPHLGLWSYEISCLHPISKGQIHFKSYPHQHKPWNQFELGLS